MRKIFYFILLIFGITIANTACDDWTEMEPKFQEDMTQSSLSDEYYAQLRAYKKTDHPVTFGWFGNWTGNGATLEKCMAGLPDSVDFISIWGNWRNLSEAQLKDLRYVQNVKGTKALMCFIVANIGDQLTPEEHKENYLDYWGWNENKEEAIKKYANAICDTIDKYGYDGFDIDYEPHFGAPGNMASYDENMLLFIKTLRERLGTNAETGKLIVVDGEPQSIVAEAGPYLDYFIIQAYSSPGDYDLDNRLLNYGPNGTKALIENFKKVMTEEEITKKLIVCEDFEKYALSGGRDFKDRYGNQMKSPDFGATLINYG